MKDKGDLTVQDCMKNAWACLLKGDLEGRDEWVAMTEKGFIGKGESVSCDTLINQNMKDVTPTN